MKLVHTEELEQRRDDGQAPEAVSAADGSASRRAALLECAKAIDGLSKTSGVSPDILLLRTLEHFAHTGN